MKHSIAEPSTNQKSTPSYKRGFVLNVLATFSRRGALMAFNMICARFLSEHAFTIYGSFRITIDTIGQIAGKCIDNAVVVTVGRKGRQQRIGNILLAGVILALGLSLAVFGLILIVPGILGDHIQVIFRQPALILIAGMAMAVSLVFSGAIQGLKDFATLAKIAIGFGLILICVGTPIALSFSTSGAIGTIAGLFVIETLALLFFLTIKAKKRYGSRTGLLVSIKELMHFVGALSLTIIVTRFSMWLAYTFVLNLPDGATRGGEFYAAWSVFAIATVLPGQLSRTSLAYLSDAKVHQSDGFALMAVSHIRHVVFLAGTILVGLSTIMPLFLRLTFGERFISVSPAACLLLGGGMLTCFCGMVNQIFMARRQMLIYVLANCMSGPTYVLLAWTLTPRFDLMGQAGALAISQLVPTIVCLVYLYRLARPAALRRLVIVILGLVLSASVACILSLCESFYVRLILGIPSVLVLLLIFWKSRSSRRST